MEENFEQQEIIKEYFEKQKNTKLTLCICEKNIEWFYADNVWNHIAVKKQRSDGEWVETYFLETKDVHTFNKKAEIGNLSFEYYMVYDYLKFHNNAKSEYCSSVQAYISRYLKLKDENRDFTLKNYHELIQTERQRAIEGCKDCFLWILTVFFILGGITLPIAVLTCPLTWKFINKLKIKLAKDKEINNL